MASGQLFSQRVGYAVHAMAFIGNKPAGELTTLSELAEWMRTIWPAVSETYLSNVIQRMARSRLLRSHRGIAGGYSLGRAATRITLRDIVELLDGAGLDLERCALSLEDRCPVPRRCLIQKRLAKLESQFLKSLQEVTVADLATDIVLPRKTKKRS